MGKRMFDLGERSWPEEAPFHTPSSLQYLNAGLAEELVLSVAPTFLGGGKRLFEGIDRGAVGLEIIEAIGSPEVTHLRYAAKRKR
jgi:dihydrofolate reductase